ncbi:ultraviolet-B receptor UVR8 [Acrasis kona]|uniref:Ultraviolet-B receptor UVR8 n=1 Tax=Acrasis kona TaxID=1008807 RepID=A0AAW2YY40_9EUKA
MTGETLLCLLLVIFSSTVDAQMFTFGQNHDGQLGSDTSGKSRYEPTPLNITNQLLMNMQIESVHTGYYHSILKLKEGVTASFGQNKFGQLGNNQTVSTPILIDTTQLAGKKIMKISCGRYHSVISTDDHLLFSFGSNTHGQLGTNNVSTITEYIPTPVYMSGHLNNIKISQISCGNEHTLVLSSDNKLFSFGSNQFGQLGIGAKVKQEPIAVPVTMSGVLLEKSISQISCGAYHSVVVTKDGRVYSYGDNLNGQLGHGQKTKSEFSPVEVDTTGVLSNKHVVQASAGTSHTVLLTSDGDLYSFGHYGLLGDGSSEQQHKHIPVRVDMNGVLMNKRVKQVAAGAKHSIGVTTDDVTFTFGHNTYGQLGTGDVHAELQLSPVLVNMKVIPSGKTVKQVAAGSFHSAILLTDRTRVGLSPVQITIIVFVCLTAVLIASISIAFVVRLRAKQSYEMLN